MIRFIMIKNNMSHGNSATTRKCRVDTIRAVMIQCMVYKCGGCMWYTRVVVVVAERMLGHVDWLPGQIRCTVKAMDGAKCWWWGGGGIWLLLSVLWRRQWPPICVTIMHCVKGWCHHWIVCWWWCSRWTDRRECSQTSFFLWQRKSAHCIIIKGSIMVKHGFKSFHRGCCIAGRCIRWWRRFDIACITAVTACCMYQASISTQWSLLIMDKCTSYTI